jgi:hypothetical protein
MGDALDDGEFEAYEPEPEDNDIEVQYLCAGVGM